MLTEREARSLSVEALTGYLAGTGWSKLRTTDRLTLWQSASDPAAEVTVPTTSDYADFPLRVFEVLSGIARVEGKDVHQALRSVRLGVADVWRIRLLGDGAAGGTIPVSTGGAILEGARRMARYAAQAALGPRAGFGPSMPSLVGRYLEAARFGQTEQGSYVFTVHSPLFRLERDPQGEPFERRVVQGLSRSLRAISADADPAALVDEGVSWNLCRSISDVVEAHGDGVSFGFSFAGAVPLTTPELARTPVEFTGEDLPRLDSVSSALRVHDETPEFLLRGFVSRLQRDAETTLPPDLRGDGLIVVWGEVNGEHKNVRVSLDPKRYSRATEAHDLTYPVTIRGKLVRRGRYLYMEEVSYFRVIAEGRGPNASDEGPT